MFVVCCLAGRLVDIKDINFLPPEKERRSVGHQ